MKKNILLLSLVTIQTLIFADVESLGEIEVISTNKTKQKASQSTSNIDVITSEEIRQNGYTSIVDALSNTLGINISQNGGIGQKSSFFLRGMDSGKILVLVDGMRLNDPSTTNSTSMIEFLPISNVEQIEVIRGGSSSVWGANASAGVINIITKEALKDGVTGSVGINGGSHQTKGSDVSLFYKNGKLNTRLLGSIFDTNGISALAPQKSEKDGYNSKNLTAGIGYDFTDTTKASIALIKTKTKGDYDDEYNSNSANDDYSNFITDSTNIAGTISTKVGSIDSVFNITHGNYKREYFTTSLWGDGDNRYEATTNEYSLINSYAHKFGKSVLGFEYKDIDGFNQYNTYAPTDGSFINRGIFLSNSINPTDKLLIEANLRYDDFDKFDGKVTYKLGAKYNILDNASFRANYYTSLNAPSVYQLANPVFGEILKPSFVNGYDMGLSYKDFVTLTYFDNKIKDDIVYDYTNWGYYNNSADENIRGLELAFSTMNIYDNFRVRANYTHLIDMKDTSGTPLYNRPKDETNGWLEYFYDENTIASLNAQYIGERYSPFGYPASPMASGNYTVWNLNLTKKYNDNIDVGLHLKNLFDKEYQSIYNYNSEGRSIYADVRYRF
ncbi:TonB dependent receptor [Sulfurovum sp. enrichment culture clone C5]|uniref:TonB dependent receptor n=1 Tax=Sulfurovum sp. enrichment culture clone C5 TaxID=497650 RepID=A0A0S4XQF0_9BACT|nr:TonB dependent receptor [Sulfurovum sp. enrichment culture clone C5]